MMSKTLQDDQLVTRSRRFFVGRAMAMSASALLCQACHFRSRAAFSFWLFLVACLLADAGRVDACSAVASREGFGFLGANFDWRARGGIVFESPRGQVKTSFSPLTGRQTMTWTSRLASLTVSQFGRDFPMQGMNEAGLSGLVLMGPSAYPETGPLGVVTENLWLQYQLDHYETVYEVVDHVGDLGIEKLSAALHWFFCDRSGSCAVVEFIEGRGLAYTDETLNIRALTNSPYQASVRRFEAWSTSEQALPQGYESFARFIRLAEMTSRADFGATASAMSAALDSVAANGYTAWQTVFDLEQRRLRIKLRNGTMGKSPWQSLDFDAVAKTCSPELRMMVLGQDDGWIEYDHEMVAQMFADAAQGTHGLDADARQRILKASESVICEPRFH